MPELKKGTRIYYNTIKEKLAQIYFYIEFDANVKIMTIET